MKQGFKGQTIFHEAEETSAFLSKYRRFTRALFSVNNRLISFDEPDMFQPDFFLSNGYGIVKYDSPQGRKGDPKFMVVWDGFVYDPKLRNSHGAKNGNYVAFDAWRSFVAYKSPYIKFLLEFSTLDEELFAIACANPGMPFAFSIDYKKYIAACGCDAYHSRFYTRKMLEQRKTIKEHNKKQSVWYNPEAEKVFNKLKESK